MSRAKKFNVIQVVVWGIVAVAVVVIFSQPDTISEWGDNRLKTLCLAFLFFLGLGTDFVIRIIERKDKNEDNKADIDIAVEHKSVYVGFIVLFLYIFILSISLYIRYEADGLMPVGWIWFVAYSSIVIANLATGIASLFYYERRDKQE